MDLTTALACINTALLIIGGLGLGEYLKKRAENLATRKDIEDLTRKVEVIKAEISEGVWSRQKRWELKREVLFEATKRLREIDDALQGLDTRLQHDQKSGETTLGEYSATYLSAAAKFYETILLVGIGCSKETEGALKGFLGEINQVMSAIVDDRNTSIYKQSQEVIFKSLVAAQTAIRKELGIDNAP
jgi:hypothetical protein